MSAKRGWSTYWLLLFTFVTPCKVVCHACVFYISYRTGTYPLFITVQIYEKITRYQTKQKK